MFYVKKCVFSKYFEGYTTSTKDVCFISVFVVIRMASGLCSFPSVRILEELNATVTTCVKKYRACDVYFCWHEAFVSYTKVKPGQHLLRDLSRRYHFDCISQII